MTHRQSAARPFCWGQLTAWVAFGVLPLACGTGAGTPAQSPAASKPAQSTADDPAALAAGERLVQWVQEVDARAPVKLTTPAAPTQAARGLTRGVGDAADRALSLGDAAMSRQDYTRALEHYRQARRLLPTHPAAVVGIVNARFGLTGLGLEFAIAPKDKRLAELFVLLDEAAKLDAQYAPLALSRGRLLLVQGRAAEAQAQFEHAVAKEPGAAEAHSGLGIARLAQGDIDAAQAALARAVELDGNNVQHLSNWGAVLVLKQRLPEAITTLRKARELAPNDARICGDLGTALLGAGQVDEALQHLQHAHTLQPARATFMSNLGYAHQLKGDLEQAESWCRKAIAADSQLGSAWINLGVVLAAKKQWNEAQRAFKHAQKLDPSDPRPASNLQDLAELRRQSAPNE